MSKIKAFKIRKKDYHLTNEKTGEKLTVFPPAWPGANADRTNPKNEAGEWVRRYDIKDRNGIALAEFAGDTVILTHTPKAAPSIVINSERWITRAIEVEAVATTPVDASTTVAGDATAPTAKPKKAAKSKSKSKLMETVEADVKSAATSAPKRAHVKSHKATRKAIVGDKK
jgi:hypothetical protein